MARQGGILKIKGTIGGLTFYKSSQDGHLVREQGGVSADRIANDPAFIRTRENGQEFGHAGASGKVLRDALRNLMMTASDGRVTSRLTKTMMDILKKDSTSVRGQRNVTAGLDTPEGKALLKGFNFNINALLGAILFKDYTLDVSNGEVTFSQLTPLNDIVAPRGASHCCMKSAVAHVDFTTGTASVNQSPVSSILLNNVPADVTLAPAGGNPAGTGTVFNILVIEFF